jgi:hypothetical protein
MSRAMWCCAGFFAAGYFPTILLRNPAAAMAAAAAGTIPVGSLSASVRQGMLRGVGLGAIAGGAIGAALFQLKVPAERLGGLTAVYGLATVAMCAAIAALFAYRSRLRRERIEREWQ